MADDGHNDGDKGVTGNSDADEKEIVIERRIDRRLEEIYASDRPWLRRIIGTLIIAASLLIAWMMLRNRAEDIRKEVRRNPPVSIEQTTDENPNPGVLPPADTAVVSAPAVPTQVVPDVTLDASSANTISECTKGIDAFRELDLDPQKISAGEATLESVFGPALTVAKGRASRETQLENVRIRTKSGEELRLHVTPGDQRGRLYHKLFRVADDGLPEETEFPDELKDLKDQPYSREVLEKFLTAAVPPGQPIEIEKHEAWTFADKSGAQIIVSNDKLVDLQIYVKGKFLACTRQTASVACKCIDR